MPVTFQFWGNQVGIFGDVEEQGANSEIEIQTLPFLPTDRILITFSDASFTGGEFNPEGPIEFISVQVVRDGEVHDLTFEEDPGVIPSDNGSEPEQGDSFFMTETDIGPAASGPFSTIPEGQYVFVANTTLTEGQTAVIPKVTGPNGDGNFDIEHGTNGFVTAFDDAATLTEDDGSTAFSTVVDNDLVPDGVDTVTLITGPAEGSLTLNTDGTYSFDPLTDFDDLAVGETRDVTFVYEVADLDGDSDQATVTITVTGANDDPVITSDASDAVGTVVEAGNNDDGTPEAGDPTANGTLTWSDVDNGATATWSGDATGTYGSFVIDPNTGDWTYTLDNNDADTDALAEGETGIETFTATITDEHGGTAIQIVTITITGKNDAPVITSSASEAEGDVIEAGNLDDGTVVPGTPVATATLTSSDPDIGATATWTGDDTGTYGTFSIDPNTGEWTYTLNNADPDTQNLAEGESDTEVFTVTVTDDNGARETIDVTITVTGTNDSPVVTSDAADASGTVIEAGNLDNGNPVAGDPTANGSLSSSDVDNGSTATWSGDATGTYGSFTIQADGDWSYVLDNNSAATQALSEGEVVYDTFVATVTDDMGAVTTEIVTITVTGTNDSPVITSGTGDAEGDVVEDGSLHDGTEVPGTPSATGTLSFTDPDNVVSQNATWSIDADGGNATDLGNMSIDPATGQWTYTLDQGAADYLNEQEVVTETFTATITDEFGATSTETVTITITGTNDSAELNSVDDAPAPRMVGAEWLSIDVDDAMINATGQAVVDVSGFSASPTSSNDIIINDVGTEALTQLEIKNFGGAGDADDKIRLDLTAFDDDFTLIINGESPGDQLILTGVDSVVYNADFTQTVTYTGSDGQTHLVTISDDIPFDQVTHYGTDDDIVDGTSADEVISDGYNDYAGDEVQDTADNVIFGHGGADTITGGTGADTIFGDFDKPAGTLTEDLSQPTPTAEVLTFSITDTEIDKDGAVDIDVSSFAVDVDGEEDIVFTDDGTEDITSIHIAKMGKGDGEQDVFRFDLSTFDDDFTITVWSEGTEDYFVFSNADSIVDNGDGTSTITYTGSDDQTHTVTIDTGLANLEFYTGEVSQEFDDVIDAAGGDDSVDGGYGQDTIDGGDGADTLIGNVGADSIDGGAGDDAIYGDFNEPLDPLPPRDPLPWAEELTVDIDDADIDNLDGTVEIPVNTLTSDPNMSQDVVINDGGTEAISEITVTQLGGTQVDVIRLDLTGFDDDFDFIAENVGSEDVVIFTGADSVVDNGDGTHTITYTGSDDQIHTVVVDVNTAQLDVTYATVDETAFEDDGDLIDGGSGDDTIDSGYGDDTIIASAGADSIIGGTGNDTYDVASSTTLSDEAVTVTVNTAGSGTVVKTVDGTTDTISEMERFVADENAGNDDITITTNVLNNEVTGLDGDEIGIFTPDSGAPISFGGPGEPTLEELLSGTYVPLGETEPVDPNGDYAVYGDDLDFEVGSIAFENFETVNFSVGAPVCFARGSHILTQNGEIAVENLSVGDRLLTWDHGYQTVRWIGKSRMLARGASAPVIIKKGALGNTRDLVVSQQHRILLSGSQVEMLFGETEAFAPAKSLVNHGSVQIVEGGLIDYYHVFLDRHEILYSEGVLSESFYPGDIGLCTISEKAALELFDLRPELKDAPDEYGETARKCLKHWEAKMLADTLPSLGKSFFLQVKNTSPLPFRAPLSSRNTQARQHKVA